MDSATEVHRALQELGGPPPADPALVAGFVRGFLLQLDRDLAQLGVVDRGAALSLLYEQLAARLVSQG